LGYFKYLQLSNTQGEGILSEQILVVDDDADIRAILGMVLKRSGYNIWEASDGYEAIEIASRNACDLILLDLNMPELSGFEVCKRLKSDEKTKNVPVIFLTASGDSSDKISAFDIGAADYITKTFNKDELLARVKTQLKLAKALSSLEYANQRLIERQEELYGDLQAAARIQETLLPKSLDKIAGIKTAWKFLPSNIVAGDLFNIVPLGPDHLAIYMLDVSGHGVSSAMVTVSLYQTLHSIDSNILYESESRLIPARPSQVLQKLNKTYPIERFGKYFTMAYVLLNSRTGEMSYSLAGHPSPILIRSDGSILLLSKGGTITGFDEFIPFEEETVTLKKGDKIVIYTDGLLDNVDCPESTEESLLLSISQHASKPIDQIIHGVSSDMLKDLDYEDLIDDVSIFAFEYEGQ